VSNIISEVGFWLFWSCYLAHDPTARQKYFALKCSLETRLESESFEPLINFLLFLVKMLWPKINKIIV